MLIALLPLLEMIYKEDRDFQEQKDYHSHIVMTVMANLFAVAQSVLPNSQISGSS